MTEAHKLNDTIDYRVLFERHKRSRNLDVELHPQFKTNPTEVICFWCNTKTGETALLGNNYPDRAPHAMVVNYDFCLSCQERAKGGIWCIEVVPSRHSNIPEIEDGITPTGRKFPMSRASIDALPLDHAAKQATFLKGMFYVPKEVFDRIAMRIVERVAEKGL